MAPHELRANIVQLLTDRLARMGMSENDLTEDLDLVRSGLLDSLAFIDLITALEKLAGKELDLDAALDRQDATTIAGLKNLFQ